ncbi:unnamed protein product [Toxocara canis]|uniref:Ig-like domain-containing protein n=1 Tax=Toxocara canis TaxID=6265 RepID=A0A183UPY4_TOXCA|nr:unnamed protein product [Toxocara canis]
MNAAHSVQYANGFKADYCSRIVDGPQMTFDLSHSMMNQVIRSGSRAVFECIILSTPQARISWYHNGMLIRNEDGAEIEYFNWESKGDLIGMGTVQSRMVIPCADERAAGKYACRADSPCGQTISTSARLDIVSKPGAICHRFRALAPTITTMTTSRIELDRNIVQLMCRAIGAPSPVISWSLEDDEIEGKFVPVNESRTIIQLANGDLLVSAPDNTVASQVFRCIAHNQHGDDHMDASVVYLKEERKK